MKLNTFYRIEFTETSSATIWDLCEVNDGYFCIYSGDIFMLCNYSESKDTVEVFNLTKNAKHTHKYPDFWGFEFYYKKPNILTVQTYIDKKHVILTEI